MEEIAEATSKVGIEGGFYSHSVSRVNSIGWEAT